MVREQHPPAVTRRRVNGQRFSQFTAPSHLRGYTFAHAVPLIVVLALVSGCTGKESAPTAMAQGPVAVLVAPVEQKTVPNQLREVGTVEAYSTVSISGLTKRRSIRSMRISRGMSRGPNRLIPTSSAMRIYLSSGLAPASSTTRPM